MKYLKLFDSNGDRYIKVKVRKIDKVEDGKKYKYELHINGKKYLYYSFPFVKDQDNFEILSETDTEYEIEIDKKTFENNK